MSEQNQHVESNGHMPQTFSSYIQQKAPHLMPKLNEIMPRTEIKSSAALPQAVIQSSNENCSVRASEHAR